MGDYHFWGHITGLVAVVLLFGGPVLVWIVCEIARNWRKVRISEHLSVLKQSMIERGMCADDIERILNAGTAPAQETAKTR
jgi:hypothetical protein